MKINLDSVFSHLMAYSYDLRTRVIEFVEHGGSKAEASRLFQVSIWCVNQWCKTKQLTPNYPNRRKRKLDWHGLKIHVQKYPDALLRERAEHFDVHINAIWYAMEQMKLTRKKNPVVPRKKT